MSWHCHKRATFEPISQEIINILPLIPPLEFQVKGKKYCEYGSWCETPAERAFRPSDFGIKNAPLMVRGIGAQHGR